MGTGGENFKKNFVKGWPQRTICEVLREIYWGTEDLEVRRRVIEATDMAKKMDIKLREYSGKWDKGWWEKVDNAEAVKTERMKKFQAEEEERNKEKSG
jgi:hypothetical protein